MTATAYMRTRSLIQKVDEAHIKQGHVNYYNGVGDLDLQHLFEERDEQKRIITTYAAEHGIIIEKWMEDGGRIPIAWKSLFAEPITDIILVRSYRDVAAYPFVYQAMMNNLSRRGIKLVSCLQNVSN